MNTHNFVNYHVYLFIYINVKGEKLFIKLVITIILYISILYL